MWLSGSMTDKNNEMKDVHGQHPSHWPTTLEPRRVLLRFTQQYERTVGAHCPQQQGTESYCCRAHVQASLHIQVLQKPTRMAPTDPGHSTNLPPPDQRQRHPAWPPQRCCQCRRHNCSSPPSSWPSKLSAEAAAAADSLADRRRRGAGRP